jgi:hypothetical protein
VVTLANDGEEGSLAEKACSAARVAMRPNLTLFLGVLAALAIVSGTAPAAKAHAPADRRREAYVDVGVATLWVQPRTNRPIENRRSPIPLM